LLGEVQRAAELLNEHRPYHCGLTG
jgi:hypothetical protein